MKTFTLLAGLAGLASASVDYLGVAIAGIDFGCAINGTCDMSDIVFPLMSVGGVVDGAAQMKHFKKKNGLNMFRLPVSWQYLTDSNGGSDLDSTNFNNYKELVKTCLDLDVYCQIDLHNFARYDDEIIGQGGPSNDDFSTLWTNIMAPYVNEEKIVVGLMNEPHDLNLTLWAETVQAAVTAIRDSGATSQMILLPGTNFTNAEQLVENGSADLMLNVTNPDGTTDNLILDIHKYLDENNSGTYENCTTNNVDAFNSLAEYLRGKNRTGMISETGAYHDDLCTQYFCEQNQAIMNNSDVYIGLTGWAAGSFDSSYILTLTPTYENGKWTDNELFTTCMLDLWDGAKGSSSGVGRVSGAGWATIVGASVAIFMAFM